MASKKAKVAVIGHRAGSRRAKAHRIISAAGRNPDRQEVLKKIKRLGVTPATASTWYSSMRGTRSKEVRA